MMLKSLNPTISDSDTTQTESEKIFAMPRFKPWSLGLIKEIFANLPHYRSLVLFDLSAILYQILQLHHIKIKLLLDWLKTHHLVQIQNLKVSK
jgi:hypothetical protein